MSDKKINYDKYLTKISYERYDKCMVIKKYKVISDNDIGKAIKVKDKNNNKIYKNNNK